MKKLLSIVLTIALCLSFMPYSAHGESPPLDKKDSQFSKTRLASSASGEAVILLDNGSVSASSAQSPSSKDPGIKLPKGIEIDDTLVFEDIPVDKDIGSASALSSQSTSDTSELVVMNLNSDNYSTEKLVEILSDLPGIKYAEPNYRCQAAAVSPNKYFDYQWGLENSGQNNGIVGNHIGLDNIWADTNSGTKKTDTIVAVIDTGIDYTHEDLKDNLWVNKDLGKLSGKHGFNFLYYSDDPMDDNGHGTHVSGIIGGAGKNINGITGVDKSLKIMSLKFLDESGYGYFFGALSAYEYINKAISLGYKVKAANNSWDGIDGRDSKIFKEIIDAVGKKGCITVCSAGNETLNNDEYDSFPSSIDSEYIVSVAASTEDGGLAYFSNFGKETVDIAAPGTSILSSVSYDCYNPTIYSDELKDELSNVFLDFEQSTDLDKVEWQNWDGYAWSSSKGAGTSSAIEITDEDFFGLPDNSSHSLKWTINDLDPEGMYHLYIPYTTTDSSVPIQASSAMKIIKCADSEPDEWEWGSEVLITDTRLTASGDLPDEYKNIFTMFDLNFCDYAGTDHPMNSWDNLNFEINSGSRAGRDRALVFTYFSNNGDTEHEILFDDLGISMGGDSNESLGKHAFYSGTSMAAPMVTGALALLSEAKPAYPTEQLALEIANMTDGSSLDAYVASGGILDMSNYRNAKPLISKIAVSGNNVLINGYGFGSTAGSVKVDGVTVPSANVVWKDKLITIPAANVKNKLVTFTVTTASGKIATKEAYVVSGKPTFSAETPLPDDFGGSLTTDGKELYYAGFGGCLCILKEEPDDDIEMFSAGSDNTKVTSSANMIKYWDYLKSIDPKTMFPDATAGELSKGMVLFDTEVPYVNGKFYTIVSLNSGYSTCYALAAYDPKKDKWTRIADRPGAEATSDKSKINKDFENVQMSSLAAYNGKLYLMGGMNMVTNNVSNKVQVYDPGTKKWSAGPQMPGGRFLGVARQTTNKLVLSLGGNGKSDNSATCPLIFNGKTWSTGKSIDAPMKNSEYYVLTSSDDPDAIEDRDPYTGRTYYYKLIPYYNAAVGIVSNGLIYGGLPSNSLGDTYTYAPASNAYTASSYQYKEKTADEELIGIAVGKTFYMGTINNSLYDDDDDDYYDDRVKSYDTTTGSSIDDTNFFSIPVKSGLLKVTVKKVKGGKTTGKGSYLPGQKVKIKHKTKKTHYFKKMKVGNVTTKKKTHTIKAITKHTHIKPSIAKYKTKVKLNKKNVTLAAGKSIKLKAKVIKPAKKKKGVKWSVSNKKYAKVSKSGKVTVKKAGIGKTVKVYAKAKDGSKAKAVCKIIITK